MIYICWNYGWRINERKTLKKDNERIGEHKLWNHHPFLFEYYIEDYKQKGVEPRCVPVSDWNENGYWRELENCENT